MPRIEILTEELAAMRVDNDRGVIIINGKRIAVINIVRAAYMVYQETETC